MYLQYVPFVTKRNKEAFPLLVNTLILITKEYTSGCKCSQESVSFTKLIGKIAL